MNSSQSSDARGSSNDGAVMPKKTSHVRLQKELKMFTAEPPPYIPRAHVNENNMLEWHFLFQGPHGTPYEGGWYVSKVKFPEQYPFKPPDIYMCTPTGRFAPGVKLCTTMSSFHPETWNPAWSAATIAKGLLSFMTEDEITAGSIRATDEEKRALAASSVSWNLAHGGFKRMFPELDGKLDEIATQPHPAAAK